MHYVICYDIENDRLRVKAAKLLERHGCKRIQRSVFVVANMQLKEMRLLESALKRALLRHFGADDSLLLMPLHEADKGNIRVLGNNNAPTLLTEKPLKIIL